MSRRTYRFVKRDGDFYVWVQIQPLGNAGDEIVVLRHMRIDQFWRTA